MIPDIVYAYILEEHAFRDGDEIVKEGVDGDWLFVILDGRVKVTKKTPKGTLSIATLNVGDIAGELILLDSTARTRSATVTADGDVVVGILDIQRLRAEVSALSPRMRMLLSKLAWRLRKTTEDAVALAMKQ